jgi:apolipoprotein D and lipocalin family protein
MNRKTEGRMDSWCRGLAGLLLPLLALAGCRTAPPEGLLAVRAFEIQDYLGTWYEIARMDHWFERGLTHCQAEYALRPDRSVRVINRGYDPVAQAWREAEGVARFRDDPRVGSLRVSFFGPFYGGYHVLAWETNAPSYAVVCGDSRAYFWILARDRQLPASTLQPLLRQVEAWGFDTNQVLHVVQALPPARSRNEGDKKGAR